ncbi:glycoside hydrolase domain-containing protein [Halalkalibacterium ligniniphilum]|uniref:glycoside hydrolase domain-containing protein n=1 Tax=Halalkalibacterium ligniniphilum TaxID=1134413 RepID=UPI000344E933|nr:glycoside hydrolase domain-containing protein [Halalkalibacterium ligniniphilum]
MVQKAWGVDSAAAYTEELYTCVKNNFGNPKYWGRYLTDVPNVSAGLTKQEIELIREKGIKILPIYNLFSEAIGYEKGQITARNAVFHARRLGIPTNIALFANVERFFSVDEAWIRGWMGALFPTGYRPGIYHDPIEGPFSEAYCLASQKDPKVAEQTILWSAEPEIGITNERNAPDYKPASPNCKANVWIWQYGRDAKECPIDTNLADSRLLSYLY